MKVKFSDKGFAEAEKRLEREGLAVMRASALEMQNGTKRRVRVDTGLSRSMVVLVLTTNGAMVVGNSKVLYFHEYGTGQYHEAGGGRQDPWVYTPDNGVTFYTTTGVRPQPAFRPSFEEAIDYFHREKRRRGLG